jgi:sRNA-binding carbon storage regulator CsrA
LKFQEIDTEKENYEKQLADIKLQTINQQAELLRIGVQAAAKFQVLASELNLYVRRELNFPIDEQKYLELVDESSKKSLKVVEWFENLIEKHKHEL